MKINDAMESRVEIAIQCIEEGDPSAILGTVPAEYIVSALALRPDRVLEPGKTYPGMLYFKVPLHSLPLVVARLRMFAPNVHGFTVTFIESE